VGSISEAFTFSWPLWLTSGAHSAATRLNVPSGVVYGDRHVTLLGSGLGLADMRCVCVCEVCLCL